MLVDLRLLAYLTLLPSTALSDLLLNTRHASICFMMMENMVCVLRSMKSL